MYNTNWLRVHFVSSAQKSEVVMRKNRLLKVLSIVLSLSFVLSLWCVPAGALNTATGYYNKMMDSYTALDGTFTLSANSRFFIVSEDEPDEDLGNQHVRKNSPRAGG